MKTNTGHYVFFNFDEHEAAINEVKTGWNWIQVDGDIWLMERYLKKEFTQDDMQALCEGVVTDHCRELLDDIGVKADEVKISYCRRNRRYEIEVIEQIRDIPETNFELQQEK